MIFLTITNTQSDFIFRVQPPHRRVDGRAVLDRRLHGGGDVVCELRVQLCVATADFYCLSSLIRKNIVFILLYYFIIFLKQNQLHAVFPAHSKVGRENLVLRHCVPHQSEEMEIQI